MKKIYLIGLILVLFSSFVSAGVVVNEYMPNPLVDNDWVELYNDGSSSVDLNEWYLADDTSPMATMSSVISPNDYLVVYVGDRLNTDTDTITLFDNLGTPMDSRVYTGFSSKIDVSEGRMHDGLATWVEFSGNDISKDALNNRAPVVTSTPILTTNEDEEYSYQMVVNDLDGDDLTFDLDGEPSGMVIDQNGLVIWTPINDDVGLHEFDTEVSDGYFGFTGEELELEVLNTNDAPVITTILDQNVDEDSDFNYQVVASDVDPTNDTLTYSLTSITGASINSSDGFINWSAPDNDDVGEYEFIVFVNDGFGAVNETFNVTVDNVNDDPSITNGASAPVVGVEGIDYSFDFDASDIDPTEDVLTFSLVNEPTGMTIDSDEGVVSWTPQSDGDYTYNVSVSDGVGGSDEVEVADVEVDSAIDFKSVSVQVNGVGTVVQEGDSIDVKPGDSIVVETETENNMYGYGNYIEFVSVGYSVLDWSISGLSDENGFGLAPLGTRTEILEFDIPLNVQDGMSELLLLIGGTDANDVDRVSTITLDFSVTRNNDEIVISKVEDEILDLTCFWRPMLELNLINTGLANQYGVTVTVDSELGAIIGDDSINPEDMTNELIFNLGKGQTEDIQVMLDASSVGPGTYPFTVNVEYADEQETLTYADNAVVNECVPDFNIDEDAGWTEDFYLKAFSDEEEGDNILDDFLITLEQSNSDLIDCSIVNNYLTCDSVAVDQSGVNDIIMTIEAIGVEDWLGSKDFDFSVYVSGVNDLPVITSTPGLSASKDVLYEYQVVASDVDEDTLSYSVVGPDGMTIDSTGLVSWTPTTVGDYDVTVNVDDGDDGEVEQTWTVSVTDSALDFTSFKINGIGLSDGDSFYADPGDVLPLSIEVENNLDVDMVDVLVEAVLTLDSSVLTDQTYLFRLDSGMTKTKTLSFTLPYDILEGQYDLDVVLSGNDDDATATYREMSNTYYIDLVKTNSLLRIDSLTLADSALSCFRGTTLDVDVLNIGQGDEEGVVVQVFNTQLGVDEEQTIDYLVEDSNQLLTFDVNVVGEFSGVYPLIAKATYGSLVIQDTIDLELSNCVDDVSVNENDNGFTINLPLGYDYDLVEQSNTDLISCSVGTDIICGAPISELSGQSDIVFSATDGTDTFDNVFSIFVSAQNDVPVLSTLPVVVFNEDESYELDFANYVTDIDDTSFTWSYSAENVLLSFNGNLGTFTGPSNWYGSEQVTITVSDGQDTDTRFMVATISTIDDPAVISSYSPTFNPTVGINEELTFTVAATDVDDTVSYSWDLNGVSVGTDVNTYTFSSAVAGDYVLTVDVGDDDQSWNIEVTDAPIAETFDGSTTDFSSVGDMSNVVGVVLEKSLYGKIEFGVNLDLSSVFDLDNSVAITNSVVAIDASRYSQLSKPATITMKNQNYEGVPVVYYNNGFTTSYAQINTVCDFCNLISYDEGTVVFSTEHFSSFRVGTDTSVDYSDLDMCSAGEIGDLDVIIEEPDDDEEYLPGDEINLEIEVENDGDDDKDVKVVAVIYDVTEDEVVDKESKTEEVDDGDEEMFEITLKVPTNIDEDNEYVIYVKAYEKGDEDTQCDEEAIDMDVERESHMVIIDDFTLSPSAAQCGSVVEAIVDVENVGSNDEDVKVYVESVELGIYEESAEYELDDYDGDDNDAIVRLNIRLPERAEAKSYSVSAKVDYDDGSDSVTKDLEVYSCGASVSVSQQATISGLDLYSSSYNARAGQSISVPVKIRNDDDYKKAYTVNLENLGGWASSLSGAKIVDVDAGMESTEYLYLKVSDDSDSGMHTAAVKLSSGEGVVTRTLSVNVEASKEPVFIPRSGGLNIFLILGIVLLVLIVFYLFRITFNKKRY